MRDEMITKLSVKKLSEAINLCENLEEINRELLKFFELTYRYGSKNNNRHNKFIKVFKEYYNLQNLQQTREQKVKQQVKSRSKKVEDYTQELLYLRNEKNYSYQALSDYLQQKKVKASRETIRKLLRGYENV